MKDIFYFIKWQISRWSFGDVLWLISCGFIGSGITDQYLHPDNSPSWLLIIGLAIWFAALFKLLVIDATLRSWKKYQETKANLLNDIRG